MIRILLAAMLLAGASPVLAETHTVAPGDGAGGFARPGWVLSVGAASRAIAFRDVDSDGRVIGEGQS